MDDSADVQTIEVGSRSDPFNDTSLRDSIARELGLKNYGETKKYLHQIERLIQWAQAKGAKDNTDVIYSIKQLAGKSGSPHLGNNWAQHLSQIAFLEMERMNIDKQLEELGPSMENPKLKGMEEKNG